MSDSKSEDGLPKLALNLASSLEAIHEKTGFSNGLLKRWVRAVERKKQAILYDTTFVLDGLIEVLGEVNRVIDDAHYELGISFFLREDLDDQIADIWQMEIEPYLEEFFFNRRDIVSRYRWSAIEQKVRL